MSTNLRHGGNTDTASRTFGTPWDGWIDLSTGINPIPYPVPEIPVELWQCLPIKTDEDRLLHAARAYYGVPDMADLVFAPGTQSVIQWLPILRDRCRVQVLGPTYEEHAARWHAGGHDVEVINDIHTADADVIVVINPNNPDGRIISPKTLLDMANRQAARGGMLIVDEAFADVVADISVTSQAGRAGMIVLRSFGKFFGLAGLRLGFAIGATDDIALIRDALGPWPVAGPVLAIGATAFTDTGWQVKTRARLTTDASRLDGVLTKAGLDVVGGTPLYRLAQTNDAASLYGKLGHAGILVRIFDYNPKWLRFGLPGDSNGWDKLERALQEI